MSNTSIAGSLDNNILHRVRTLTPLARCALWIRRWDGADSDGKWCKTFGADSSCSCVWVNQALSVTLESSSDEITPLSVAKAHCFILWSLSTCSGSFPWRLPARSSSLCRCGNRSCPSCRCWWPQCTVLWVCVTPSCACTAACWGETRSPNSIDVHKRLAVLLLFMKKRKLHKRLWKWVIWSSLLPYTAGWETDRLALWQHLYKKHSADQLWKTLCWVEGMWMCWDECLLGEHWFFNFFLFCWTMKLLCWIILNHGKLSTRSEPPGWSQVIGKQFKEIKNNDSYNIKM